MSRIISLVELGYDEFFEARKNELGWAESSVARVIAEYKGAYRVKSINGEFLAKITGKQMYEAQEREDYPAVGDWVLITELPDGEAVIKTVLPRKTMLVKQYSNKQGVQIIATNIDIAFIVESVDRDYNLNRLERFVLLANKGNIKPIIVLNKTDLISKEELESMISQTKNRFGDIEIIGTSTVNEQGLSDLSNLITKGKTYCFLGSSGVGKSTLINKLLGKDEIRTGEINADTERGRHTTTTREMYFLENGGIVIDNPGTREVGIADSEIEFGATNCKFANCTHVHEPGCAVLAALKEKKFDQGKYDNYVKLKKESEFYNMNEAEKRDKSRKLGKMIKNYHDMAKDV